jgi:predicted ABC-type ATPase
VQLAFHQETTFTGKSIIKAVDRAKNQGYVLNLFYIGLDSPEEAIKRVKHRVSKGGHNVPAADIIRRYPISVRNLFEQIHKFNNIEIIDNMKRFNTIFKFIDNRIVFTADDLPEWAANTVEKYKKLVYKKG